MRALAPSRAALPSLAVLALATAALCSGCGSDDQASPDATLLPHCTSTPAEPIALEGREAMFDLSGVAAPVDVTEADGFLHILARSDEAIPDLTTDFQQIVTDAGFDLAGADDEGFEAEVFFARGDVAAGQVRMVESQCDGFVDVDISVLDDPSVLPPETGGTA